MTVQQWIEYPTEPKELILAWQAAPCESVADRLRWAVGRLTPEGNRTTFAYLTGDEFVKLNLGRTETQIRSLGYAGYPAFDPKRQSDDGFHDRVLDAFLRRLPPPSRRDYGEYLAYFHVRRDARLSPLSLLAITEARLPSDGFSLIDPLNPVTSRVDVVIEVAGFRHFQDRHGPLREGDALHLEPEPSNVTDPNAIRFMMAGQGIGYVNRLQAPTVGVWLNRRAILGRIARIHDRSPSPRAYAFLQIRPTEERIAA